MKIVTIDGRADDTVCRASSCPICRVSTEFSPARRDIDNFLC